MDKRAAYLLSAVALVTAISGCALAPVNLDPAPASTMPAPLYLRSNAVVAVYYSPAFSGGTVRESSGFSLTLVHQPGAASVAMFDQVLEAAFGRVVRLEQIPAAGSIPPGVDAIFVPELARLSMFQPQGLHIRFEIRALTPVLDEIDSWEFSSNAARVGILSYDENYAALYRAAAAQLLIDLDQRPKLEALRRRPGPAPENVANRDAPLVALLPEPGADARWAECVAAALGESIQSRIVPAERFIDALFPWMEPAVLRTTADLESHFRHAAGHRHGPINQFRLAVMVGGETTNETIMRGPLLCGGGPMGGAGCLGAASGGRSTIIRIGIWDLALGKSSGKHQVEQTGNNVLLGLLLPVPLISPTEGRACERAAEEIRQALDAAPLP